ncbi:Fanconi anemia group A protein [Chanos chanos]|uniref:Fanconi anemia group A protein n=1 Tax=Chanos chanos TaxID=29144 RepID=A0A6J2W8Q4_CHACN|nr:Fanconi anemia group A protein [Chanos chanos]
MNKWEFLFAEDSAVFLLEVYQVIGQKRPLHTLLASRIGKRPRLQTEQELQGAAIQLLNRHQNISDLIQEVGVSFGVKKMERGKQSPKVCKVSCDGERRLQVHELSRQAEELAVPVGVLSVRVVSQRVLELTAHVEGDRDSVLLNCTQRARLYPLLQSARQLLSVGAFSPELFFQEYWRVQPKLEVVYHVHSQNILSLDYMLESESRFSTWLRTQLQTLCDFTTTEQEDEEMRKHILSTVLSVLVRIGFEESQNSGGAGSDRKLSQLCCSVLDSMLAWLLDSLGDKQAPQPEKPAVEVWGHVYKTSCFGVSVSSDSLRRFFTHSLTVVLTHRPRFKVSDAITMQSEWSFAKSSPPLTALFCKVNMRCVLFSMEELLSQLQQILETHEVNWQHVLSYVSTLLVYHSETQASLKELLSRLLTSAFQSYELESMITAFLLARHAALEGPAVFPSYSDWFKISFGGANSHHSNSKKSTVFLLKFLSDLVPFDPPQYLKVHILHPPYIAGKHRVLLQEYVSLARTRLADLKVPVEQMGMYEDVSGTSAAAPPQCQAEQDVEKAVSLFETTGKISATVMEASIFRRPYFMSRFLPALLVPRMLPVKADARMTFIEALRKAEKIPASLYSAYLESCQREKQRQQDGVSDSVESDENPQRNLQLQLEKLRALFSSEWSDGDVSAQLARVSAALDDLFLQRPEEVIGQTVVKVNLDAPDHTERNFSAVDLVLQSFCQCLLAASRLNSPDRQGSWASQYVKVFLGNRQLLTALLHRVWDLLHNQGELLSTAHVLGLSALVAELHVCRAQCDVEVELWTSPSSHCVCTVPEVPICALPLSTHTDMSFSLRFCVAAVCYGLCKGPPHPDGRCDFIPNSLCKKLWRHPALSSLRKLPDYHFSFPEWLAVEVRVERGKDVLSDIERQEYERWACQQQYLPPHVDEGGCGGDLKTMCAHIINAVIDLYTGEHTPQILHRRSQHRDTCLPDILSMLQELVCERELSVQCQGMGKEEGHFLLDLVTQRCCVKPDQTSISPELTLQQSLYAFNRVVLALPAAVLYTVKTEGRKRTLDYHRLLEHINHSQGYVSAQPPVSIVTALCWVSHWSRLTGAETLPEQLQLVADCYLWASRLVRGLMVPVPAGPPLLLAACVYSEWQRQDKQTEAMNTSLERLAEQHTPLLLYLLFFCVNDLLSSYLKHQGTRCVKRVQQCCTDILALLVDSADWLILFNQRSSEQNQYQSITMITTDELIRLMPLAFYSLIPRLDTETLSRAVRVPGFISTAVLSYTALLKLFLDGQTPSPRTDSSPHQVLSEAKQVLLKSISMSPQSCLTNNIRAQLEAACGELDPEVAAALSVHLNPSSLSPDFSPDLDFL